MEGGAGVRASGWARKGRGADAGARGKAGLGEGGMVGCGQNWAHGVLPCDDSIEATLLGIQPFSECFPLHIGLWHQ